MPSCAPAVAIADEGDETVRLYDNDSTTVLRSSLEGPHALRFADVDGDGAQDLVVAFHHNDSIVFYRGAAGEPNVIGREVDGPLGLAVGDFPLAAPSGRAEAASPMASHAHGTHPADSRGAGHRGGNAATRTSLNPLRSPKSSSARPHAGTPTTSHGGATSSSHAQYHVHVSPQPPRMAAPMLPHTAAESNHRAGAGGVRTRRARGGPRTLGGTTPATTRTSSYSYFGHDDDADGTYTSRFQTSASSSAAMMAARLPLATWPAYIPAVATAPQTRRPNTPVASDY